MTRGNHRVFGPSGSRCRPRRFSIVSNQRMQSSGDFRVLIIATALMNSGPDPGGHAGVR